MSININTSTDFRKLVTLNQPNKKEQFKKVLNNQELISKKSIGEDESTGEMEQIQQLLQLLSSTIQSDYKSLTINNGDIKLSEIVEMLDKSKENNEEQSKIRDVLQKLMTETAKVKGDLNLLEDTSIQRGSANSEDNSIKDNLLKKIIQSLSVSFESAYETSTTNNGKLKPIKLENLLGQEKVTLESKENNKVHSQILDVLQKLTTETVDVKGDLNLLKNRSIQSSSTNSEDNLIKDDLLKKLMQQSTNTVGQDNDYEGNNKLKEDIMNFIEGAIDKINQNTEKPSKELLGEDKVSQIQKIIQSLSSTFESASEVVNQSKGENENYPKILEMLQKMNAEYNLTKNNLLKNEIGAGTKIETETISQNQMQNSGEGKKQNEFSRNSSSEEKFLNNLLGGDKDEMKISKAVNFMNQFEAVKTVDTAKVQIANTVIGKSDFGADVIKNIKFMEINNIKDLIVRMNPKELGEITIKLTMESGIMRASISAQNKETYNLLNGNIQDIGDKLKNMDIKIQSLDINVYEDSTFFNKDSNKKNNNGRQNHNSKTNMILEDDISISNNYAIEENQVNKFV